MNNVRMELDADNKILGRLASKIALILQGKEGGLSPSENLVISNVSKIKVTGKKYYQKKYYKHSTRPGHLKVKTYREVFQRNPAKILERAVYNMLPKNKLRRERMKKLRIS